jgi:hypothetical protein
MQVPRRWERRAKSFLQQVMAIEDGELRFAVGVFLEALNDGEDDCAVAIFAPETELRIAGINLDADIHAALAERTSPETVLQAAGWIQDTLQGGCPAYTAWLLKRVEVANVPEGMTEIVSSDGLVWDLEQRRLVRKQRRRR